MKSRRKIILTGGGSAGHVVPNLALVPKLQQENWEIYYIGSKDGLERNLVTAQDQINYFSITTGKLHRCFSWSNFLAPFKVLAGIVQAWYFCYRIKPNIVFSKGGFVAFPVVFAAWLNRVPVIIHESDITIGLANLLSLPFAKKIHLASEETQNHISNKRKCLVTGIPVRKELFEGDAEMGRKICSFKANKKIILVMGGGLGSIAINKLIRELLQKLSDFQIVHSCGKGKIDMAFNNHDNYQQLEYLGSELSHILACADLVISRAGANSIYELIALRKPHILLPLSKKASRGEQLLNAQHWARLGLSRVIYPDALTKGALYQEIIWSFKNISLIKKALAEYSCSNSIELVYKDIDICTQQK